MTAEAALLSLLRVDGAGPPPALDDDALLALPTLVERHGVPGLVLAALRARRVDLPPHTLAALKTLHRRAVMDGMRVERTRDRALGLLLAGGVRRVAVLKGALLLPTLYADHGPFGGGARRVNDVDLLIGVTDQEPAHRALLAAGFRHVPKPPGRLASQRAAYERTYVREGDASVDVHVAFADPSRLRLDHGVLLDRGTPGARGEILLADDDVLISQVVHLGQDCFAGPLRGLVDVAWWLARRRPDLERAAATARASGASTVLWLALWLSRERLGAPVDAARIAALAPPRPRRDWLERLYDAPGAAPYRFLHEKRWAQALALYPLLDDPTARARFTLRQAALRMQDRWESLRSHGLGAPPGPGGEGV